ncbi:MAG: NAD(P)-binding domain-containing protein [Pseudomonadota bacterium]
MLKMIKSYMHWLHGQWPDGKTEVLPVIDEQGRSSVNGVYVVGDLTGIPLLKFSSDSGAKVINDIVADQRFIDRQKQNDILDVIIIGGGVSGYASAMAATKAQLSFELIEASNAFSTIANFPKGKPIYTYPTDMKPKGDLHFEHDVSTKEKLLVDLQAQAKASGISPTIAVVNKLEKKSSFIEVQLEDGNVLKAHRAIVAIGRAGKHRKLNVEGEEKAVNRLHDPADYKDKNVVVVGGGDSAVESALAISEAGGNVTLSYRQAEFTRPKVENIEALENASDKINILTSTQINKIEDDSVEIYLPNQNGTANIQADSVLTMLGREAPLDFFRKSKMAISGEGTMRGWIYFALFMVFAIAIYDWKNFGFLNSVWGLTNYPDQMPAALGALGEWWQAQVNDRTTLIGTIAVSMKSRSFYYTVLYTSAIGIFGYMRIKRRQTPYVTVQTITLFSVQAIPLFLLPEIFLPWLGYLGAYDAGIGQSIANSLFPSYISAQDLAAQNWPEWGHPRAYWHAYGFILAWPLNVYNVFTPTPIMGWLIISAIQTFVIIPLLIYKWGKGAYCGWICSCGALAETMGDTHRHKMPHGPFWNKLNMLGQILLFVALVMLVIRIGGWLAPESWMASSFNLLLNGVNSDNSLVNPLSWKWTVDVLLGGILGVGLYFKFSGRTWCRFACPLAALMNIYTRFSKFRIFSEKSKCISCNQCTSSCHQGIDIMSFANKGKPMEDPQCVRCSACVDVCPTGVLSFGEIDKKTGAIARKDSLAASKVQMAEVIMQTKV